MARDQELLSSPEWREALSELSEVSDKPQRIQYEERYEDEKFEEAYNFEELDNPSFLSDVEEEDDDDAYDKDVSLLASEEDYPAARFEFAEQVPQIVEETFHISTPELPMKSTIHKDRQDKQMQTIKEARFHIATQTDIIPKLEEQNTTLKREITHTATQTDCSLDNSTADFTAIVKNTHKESAPLRLATYETDRQLKIQAENSIVSIRQKILSFSFLCIFCIVVIWAITLKEGQRPHVWRQTH